MEFRSLAQSPAHRSSALRSNHAAQGNVQLRLETSMDGDRPFWAASANVYSWGKSFLYLGQSNISFGLCLLSLILLSCSAVKSL